MWDCILDNADVWLGGTDSWWLLVGQRWECYRVGGMGELALKYCHEAAAVARKSNIFTVRMEVQVFCELELIYFELLRDHEAQSTFERLLDVSQVDVAQVDVAMHWDDMSLALGHLARLHRDRGEVDQARERYEQNLELCLNLWGTEDADTADAFVDLLRFCQDHDLQDESIRLKQRYADFYNHLEESTDGLWNLDLNDDSAEVEKVVIED